MKYTLTLLLSFYIFLSYGQQFIYRAHGPGILSIGNAYTCLAGIESSFINPAGLSECSKFDVSLSAGNRFQLPELLDVQIGIAGEVGHLGNIGFSISQFGMDQYVDQKFALQYAKKLFDKLAIGVSFDLFHSRIVEYASKNTFTVELGMISQLNDKIRLGFHIFSPFGQQFTAEQTIPTILALGIRYKVSPQVYLYGEFEKNSVHPIYFKFGLEYRIIQALKLKLGAFSVTRGIQISGGAQYDVTENICTYFAIAYHPYLGLSSGIGFTFSFGKS